MPLECLPGGVLVTDSTGCLAGINDAAVAMLAKAREELMGAPLERVLPGIVQAAQFEPMRDSRKEFELRLPDARDGIHWVQCCLSSTNPAAAGRSLCADRLVSFYDIGPVVELREERRRLLQLAGVRELLPTLLHELRNPLASIRAAVEVLLEDDQASPVHAELEAILAEVHRLGLTLQGLGVAEQELRSPRAEDIEQAVAETCCVMQPVARKSGVELRTEIESLGRLPFSANAIKALIFNLVSNAVAACRDGDRVCVRARMERQGRVLLLAVADTGAGMTSDVVGRCTELFYTTKPRGSGIGLALCRRATESVFGALTIVSKPGEGTTVYIRLPLERPRKATAADEALTGS
ncbi:MAG: PAS domain-containing protein [Myxococcales bacterium FL481]|nr:MAG: PAS domain-containing protein [Myxococcales bacterium FL481]